MASPQLEDGHVRVAHELYQAIARARLAGAPRACLDCIIAHTYGWGKKEAPISHHDFMEWTGYAIKSVRTSLTLLRARNIISSKNTRPVQWSLNKDYEGWLDGSTGVNSDDPTGGQLESWGGSTKMTPLRDNKDDPTGGQTIVNKKQEASTELSKNESSAGQTANAIVEHVMQIGLGGERPDDWAKQHKAALRLVKLGVTADQAREACQGMRELFECRDAPFDCYDLERKWSKARSAYKAIEIRTLEDKADREQAARVRRNRDEPRAAEPLYLGEIVASGPFSETVKRVEKQAEEQVQ